MRVLGAADGAARALCVASCDLTFDDLLYGERLAGSRARGAQAYVSDVSVLPQMRRRGVGRALVLAAVRYALGAGGGAAAVYIHVDEDNPAACALYARCGFVEEARESPQEAARRAGRGAARRMLLRWEGAA